MCKLTNYLSAYELPRTKNSGTCSLAIEHVGKGFPRGNIFQRNLKNIDCHKGNLTFLKEILTFPVEN